MNILDLKVASKNIFLLMVGLHIVGGACFFMAGAMLFNNYKPVEVVEMLEIDDGYIFKSKKLQLKNRNVGIKFSFDSHEDRSSLPDFSIDHGSIESDVICNGRISNQSSYRLDGKYEYTNKYIYVTALEDITIDGCQIEIKLKSITFSKYINDMSVVRTGEGGVRGIPKIFEVIIKIGYFVILMYIGFLDGVLAFLGGAVMFVSGGMYFYLRKKIRWQK
ncbi:hypothetical protein [Marinomonas ostreistagni]|uniref:Uncharacterized protein n=1 Tax=Marinomonas ostreistagni TaxID=359209 RepID=A0ABS0Z719_9GAMM|nr:hypothetical protein [Marinomonas ostreistagni]MBJ7549213.1 hypothetical protein [Marinomonas ostreistagni]